MKDKVLKKFSVVIIDDKAIYGWHNSIDVIFRNRYIYYNDVNDIISNNTQFNFSIFSPISNCEITNLSNAISQIKSKQDYDIYVIDIDLSNAKFADGFDYTELAGLYFLDETQINHSPKILYSGSPKTEELFKYLNMFRKRLIDAIPIRVEDQKLSDEASRNKLEQRIDLYFKKRQIAVIYLQNHTVKRSLIHKVNNSQWDDLCVPDNGEESCEEYWSIRTLFPKQVLQIETASESSDYLPEGYHDQEREQNLIEENKLYILSILRSDWRELMKKGFLNHPDTTKLDNLAIDTVKDLEFTIEGTKISSHYKLLTKYDQWNHLSGGDSLRDNVIKDIPMYFDLEPFTLAAPSWQLELENWCKNFGIYPHDIKYLSYIASINKRHVNDVTPSLEVQRDNIAGVLKFVWTYNGVKEEKLRADKLKDKIESAFSGKRNVLEDAGITDLIKILCFRYRGGVEFRGGSVKIITTPQESYKCSVDNEFIDETKLIITLLKEGDYEDTDM